jgi:hypothetical protein
MHASPNYWDSSVTRFQISSVRNFCTQERGRKFGLQGIPSFARKPRTTLGIAMHDIVALLARGGHGSSLPLWILSSPETVQLFRHAAAVDIPIIIRCRRAVEKCSCRQQLERGCHMCWLTASCVLHSKTAMCLLEDQGCESQTDVGWLAMGCHPGGWRFGPRCS